VIGDAQSNAQVLRMQLETYKADAGVYGASGTTYAWTASGGTSGSGVSALNFTPKGNSQMNYSVAVAGKGLTYVLSVNDPNLAGGTLTYRTNQNGSVLFVLR
jgi:hypothetical protein